MALYSKLQKDCRSGKKSFAVLIDADKYNLASLKKTVKLAVDEGVDYLFFGGSLLTGDSQTNYIAWVKTHTSIPVILFPGNGQHLHNQADAILLLSLISGRNAEMLIGRHVISAPFLKASKLEILPTGYMLIESGTMTSVAYMSGTTPIPAAKDEIAVCTAMAGEMLGLKLLYLDAGSGAANPVTPSMINKVKANTKLPLIIGGGITSSQKAISAYDAGADVVVVGNAIEKDPSLIAKISKAMHTR